MKAGIALDNWKLLVFRKRLTEAGFEYKDGGPLPGDCTLLTVVTDDIQALRKVIVESHAECRRMKNSRD